MKLFPKKNKNKSVAANQHLPETKNLNNLSNNALLTIFDNLEYKDLQALACTSSFYNQLMQKVDKYNIKNFYAYAGDCEYGNIATKLVDIHFPNNGGSGPIFVPFPQVDFDVYRFTKPSAKEFLRAFVANNFDDGSLCLRHDPSKLAKLYQNSWYTTQQRPLYKIQLKRDSIVNENDPSCKLSDIHRLIKGEFNWTQPKRLGLFGSTKCHVERNLNQYSDDIERMRQSLNRK